MGSMNSNNWLSFPLSPTHPSLQSHLHSSQTHHDFNLGLVNETMDNPFQIQEWNLINTHHGGGEIPKVADFLGVSKSEHQSDLVAYNEIQAANDSDNYLFHNNSLGLIPLQPTTTTTTTTTTLITSSSNNNTNSYDFQENANNLQSLTLSMGSTGNNNNNNNITTVSETSVDTSTTVEPAVPRRSLDTFGQRTSIYRGVTRHRWTGRYEAHLWDNSCRREGQSRKGRQVYLGGYDKEEKAARAYDLAALKYWGTSTTTNFPITNYEKEVEEMKHMTRQEFVAAIRRKSSGFSRGASMYRGVTRHHQHGRWQARIGRVAGNKDLYLGTFSTEEEAAEAYDIAAIKFRGLNAVTNFDMNRYDVKSILESNTLPIGGGAAKRLKEAQAIESSRKREEMMALGSGFQYGSSSSTASRLQSYPLLQQFPFDQQTHQPQPLLTLQNQEISHHYTQDPSSFHHNYIQTQLQLHQQTTSTGSYSSLQQQSNPNPNPSFYNSYNPGLLHGLMNMDSNGSSSGSYSNGTGGGGYMGMNGVMDTTTVGSTEELALVKVDYDMPSAGYNGWSGEESVHGSNPGGVYSMWNTE